MMRFALVVFLVGCVPDQAAEMMTPATSPAIIEWSIQFGIREWVCTGSMKIVSGVDPTDGNIVQSGAWNCAEDTTDCATHGAACVTMSGTAWGKVTGIGHIEFAMTKETGVGPSFSMSGLETSVEIAASARLRDGPGVFTAYRVQH